MSLSPPPTRALGARLRSLGATIVDPADIPSILEPDAETKELTLTHVHSGITAEQAQAYRDITIDRTRENMEFVEAVNETLSITTKRIAELNGTLRLAEARTEETDAQRNLLQREVEALRGELEDPAPSTMTLWDGADVPTIVDLLSWEATAAARAQAGDEAAGEAASADEATLPEAKEA